LFYNNFDVYFDKEDEKIKKYSQDFSKDIIKKLFIK